MSATRYSRPARTAAPAPCSALVPYSTDAPAESCNPLIGLHSFHEPERNRGAQDCASPQSVNFVNIRSTNRANDTDPTILAQARGDRRNPSAHPLMGSVRRKLFECSRAFAGACSGPVLPGYRNSLDRAVKAAFALDRNGTVERAPGGARLKRTCYWTMAPRAFFNEAG
jgi:hypothetical protein